MVKNKRAPQRASKDKKMKKERKHCVLVCVTSKFRCEDLIFAGADIAHELSLIHIFSTPFMSLTAWR